MSKRIDTLVDSGYRFVARLSKELDEESKYSLKLEGGKFVLRLLENNSILASFTLREIEALRMLLNSIFHHSNASCLMQTVRNQSLQQ